MRAGRFDQLDDAVRHAVEVRNGVPRRNLHGEGLAADERAQLLMQFGPRGVRTDLAGETVERGELEPLERFHWWRGSGATARHWQPAPPRARHSTCSIAPS